MQLSRASCLSSGDCSINTREHDQKMREDFTRFQIYWLAWLIMLVGVRWGVGMAEILKWWGSGVVRASGTAEVVGDVKLVYPKVWVAVFLWVNLLSRISEKADNGVVGKFGVFIAGVLQQFLPLLRDSGINRTLFTCPYRRILIWCLRQGDRFGAPSDLFSRNGHRYVTDPLSVLIATGDRTAIGPQECGVHAQHRRRCCEFRVLNLNVLLLVTFGWWPKVGARPKRVGRRDRLNTLE